MTIKEIKPVDGFKTREGKYVCDAENSERIKGVIFETTDIPNWSIDNDKLYEKYHKNLEKDKTYAWCLRSNSSITYTKEDHEKSINDLKTLFN